LRHPAKGEQQREKQNENKESVSSESDDQLVVVIKTEHAERREHVGLLDDGIQY
jgi:hypothetical protein